jgi:hypothetical protein
VNKIPALLLELVTFLKGLFHYVKVQEKRKEAEKEIQEIKDAFKSEDKSETAKRISDVFNRK